MGLVMKHFDEEKFELTVDDEKLIKILPLGTNFEIATDCDGYVVLYDGKIFTEEQYNECPWDVMPETIYDLDSSQIFCKITDAVMNIAEFWNYIDSCY
jgi:hypothetical protein